jgi:hypothetical protein
MSSEFSASLEEVERRLAGLQTNGAPRELQPAVLADVNRELRAARWDRRLARAAAVLLVAGIVLNLAIGFRPVSSRAMSQPVASTRSQSLVDAAVVVAEVTDAATGSRFARQMAAMAGEELTSSEAAAIDAAVNQAVPQATKNGHRG